MLLYMIRHGESTANPTLSHAGWAQIPLTPRGEQDALRARELLRGITFDAVYTSDLIRAIRTKELALPDADAERSPLLREIHVGELAGKTPDACFALYGEPYIKNKKNADYRPYGGESRSDHEARVVAFLRLLEAAPASRVAAFCHEGTMKRMLEYTSGLSAPTTQHCRNGGVCIFEYQNKVWTLKEWDL